MVSTQTRSPRAERRIRVPGRWVFVLVAALLALAALISAETVDTDSGSDLLGLGHGIVRATAHLRWQFAAIVIALGTVHYVAAAVAARAAAGVPMRPVDTLLVQLAAAAANRITPAGLGGSAVNARYFSRRGLSAAAAVGAVAALSVLGGLADLLVLIVLVVVGSWLGVAGGLHEITVMLRHVTGLLGPIRSPWLWAVLVPVGGIVAVVIVRRGSARAAADRWRAFWAPTRRLRRRPGALATLLAASGATTLVLAAAFVVSTAMVPGPQPRESLGALLVAFMIGAAAGSAVPVPAGLGSTEAALTAVLISAHVPAAHAVEVVLVFRLLTFWLPAGVGVLAGRSLIRKGTL